MFHYGWQERLKRIIGPTGYQPYMRRCMQTIVLCYFVVRAEAMRRTAKARGDPLAYWEHHEELELHYRWLRGIATVSAHLLP